MNKSKIFIQKLYQIVDSPDNKECLDWIEGGNGIILKNSENLENILKKYFKSNSQKTFERRLISFGFRVYTNKNQQKLYFHKYFIKDKITLLSNIFRINKLLTQKIEQQEQNRKAVAKENKILQQQLNILKENQNAMKEQIELSSSIHSVVAESVKQLSFAFR